ncbi:threonine--tRNA ligase [Pseudonocardia lacus]|uniref:threonine--tRNA ligase n=1 Tax=Pseudonocardia lacus TaxID=2835865 RepID=UPI001BDC3CDD|nr:threonine--tRNA ligase [Pseudonocardia lacus]
MSAPASRPASAPVRVPAGTTAGAAVRAAGLPSSGPEAVVVVRDGDGTLRDLSWQPDADTDVSPVAADTDDGRAVIRHSAAHVLAQAVQQQRPEAKLGIGPPVVDGFYYDFDVDTPFTPDDLRALESSMRKIIKAGQRFSRRRYDSLDAARKELADEPYKLELIELKGAPDGERGDEIVEVDGSGELTAYDNVHAHTGEVVWSDLCRGPHVPTTKHIPAFALTRSAAAYWRGSEKNPQLQRIYGTAWESNDALQAHLDRVAEAERRDHRRLGAELDLFSFPDEIGSGLPVFHPKGGIIRREMEDYARRRHEAAGYEFVNTPHITKGQLFVTSGHLQWYADGMYPPMQLDEERNADGTVRKAAQDYYLKPMNCPMHNLIYRSRGRSYRELPLRLFEFGSVYRYEKSGVVHGLTRARGFTQDDSHIYCTQDQMLGEIESLLRFVLDLLRDYGLDEFYLELSTRDPEKSIGSDEDWERATDALRQAAEASGLELVLDPGGAAFYAPKISVQARDAIGRTWQLSTIQVDLMEPDLFGLEYSAADGSRPRPVMIHRALFGSIERFFGVLLEHYAGAFPAWLSPVQVVGIPVTEEQVPHVEAVAAALREHGVRVEVDAGDDRMQKKIRNHTLQKVPFLLLLGARDAEAGAVSFRFRDGTQVNGVAVDEAVRRVVEWIRSRDNTAPTAESFQATQPA